MPPLGYRKNPQRFDEVQTTTTLIYEECCNCHMLWRMPLL